VASGGSTESTSLTAGGRLREHRERTGKSSCADELDEPDE
jgi:hypothetical protein